MVTNIISVGIIVVEKSTLKRPDFLLRTVTSSVECLPEL